MADWQTLSSRVVHETAWIKLREDKVLNQLGKPLTYTFMELQNPSVFIVAMNDKSEVLLQQTYRYTIDKRIWEIPAGFMEQSEASLVAAKRELIEESGLESDEWQALGRVYQIVGTGNVPIEIFLARKAHKASVPTDEDEDIGAQKYVSFETIESMIANGTLVDSPVITALYIAKVHLEKERS